MENSISNILGIEKPIIQGPLFWLTNAKFVAAVSNEGGLGVLGINAGQYEPTKSIDTTIDHMREQIRETKKLTDKPFGLNLIFSDNPDKDPFTEPMINLMHEENVPVAVIYSSIYISKWFKLLKSYGITTVYRPATPDKAAILDAKKYGVDILVATGFDEGGTVPDKVVGTFSAIPYAVDLVDHQFPVMAAGGIVDARTAKSAFALGAEGIYVGTAFLATNESPMAENIKNELIKNDGYDEVLFKALPKYYRSVPGNLPNRLVEMGDNGASNETVWRTAGNYSGMRTGMLLGDLDNGFASFGMALA